MGDTYSQTNLPLKPILFVSTLFIKSIGGMIIEVLQLSTIQLNQVTSFVPYRQQILVVVVELGSNQDHNHLVSCVYRALQGMSLKLRHKEVVMRLILLHMS